MYIFTYVLLFIFFLYIDFNKQLLSENKVEFLKSDFLPTILSASASVSLLGTSLISLGLERNKENYLGVNISEFVTKINPDIFSLKEIIYLQLMIVLISITLYIFSIQFIFTIVFLFVSSFILMKILVSLIFKMQFDLKEIKIEIKKYLLFTLTFNDLEEKKDILDNMSNFYDESVEKYRIKDIVSVQNFFLELIESEKFSHISSNEKDLIFHYYFTICEIGIRSKKSRIITEQLSIINKLMIKDSNLIMNFELYHYYRFLIFPNLKYVYYSDIEEHQIYFSTFYHWFAGQIVNFNHKERIFEDYFIFGKNFYNLLHRNLPQMELEKRSEFVMSNFELIETEYTYPKKDKMLDSMYTRTIESMYKDLIDQGQYDIFDHKFKELCTEAFNFYSKSDKKFQPILIVIISYLLKLKAIKEETEKEIAIELSKKFFSENKKLLKYIAENVYNPNDVIVDLNFFDIQNIEWTVWKSTGRRSFSGVGVEIKLYIFFLQLFLISISASNENDKRHSFGTVILNNNNFEHYIRDDHLTSFFSEFKNIFSVDDIFKPSVEMIKQVHRELVKKKVIENSIKLNRKELNRIIDNLKYKSRNSHTNNHEYVLDEIIYFEQGETWNEKNIEKIIGSKLSAIKEQRNVEVTELSLMYQSCPIEYLEKDSKYFRKDLKSDKYIYTGNYSQPEIILSKNETYQLLANRLIRIDLVIKINLI